MNNLQFVIYRANKENKGSATQFQYNADKGKKCVFIVSSKQTGVDEKGNARFAWTDPAQTVTVKMGLADIGEFLTILNRVKPKIAGGKGLFHENAKGNTIINLEAVTQADKSAYSYKVSQKRDGVSMQFSNFISLGEGEIIKLILEQAAIDMVVQERKERTVSV